MSDARWAGSRIPQLPVRVVPFPAETTRSFYRRLCRANGVSETDLWWWLRRFDPSVPKSLSPRSGVYLVETLGALPPRYLSELDNAKDCHKHERGAWNRRCDVCRSFVSGAWAMCRRCAHGEAVEVSLATGPICVKHRRWHLQGTDIDVSAQRLQLTAQRVLNGPLRMRKIHYRSPEAAVVRELIHGWHPPFRQADCQIEFEEELRSLPLLVWMLTELSSPFMNELLDDNKVPDVTLAVVLREFSATAPARQPIDVVANILEREGVATASSKPPKVDLLRGLRVTNVDAKTKLLYSRIAAMRSELRTHTQGPRDPLWAVHEPYVRVARERRFVRERIARLRRVAGE